MAVVIASCGSHWGGAGVSDLSATCKFLLLHSVFSLLWLSVLLPYFMPKQINTYWQESSTDLPYKKGQKATKWPSPYNLSSSPEYSVKSLTQPCLVRSCWQLVVSIHSHKRACCLAEVLQLFWYIEETSCIFQLLSVFTVWGLCFCLVS